jgi:beta-galactosidase
MRRWFPFVGSGPGAARPRLELLEDRVLPSRSVVSLDPSWQFIRTDVPGAQAVTFDDSSWSTIDVPHTWNNLDGQTGGSYYRGVGWYRKHYVVPADQAGQEFVLRFDGASLVTDLYVNGTSVGEHRGGFAAFSWDVTPFLHVGADNVIAVKVSNAFVSDVAPLSGDFNVQGGIYRHVNLIATNPLHVSLTDFASPGVYITPSNVTADSADLQVLTKARNEAATSRTLTVQTQVIDEGGYVWATLTTSQTLAAHSGADVTQTTTITPPHLWNGRADPYLYTVVVTVLDESGTPVDQVTQPLGFRSCYVDPANGFFLNGQYLDLHGVDFHQDRLNEGWAISDADQIQDVGLIQEIGATFVRLSHYQHPALTYDLLDQAGIVAWSEIPFVNQATNSTAFTNNAVQQLREMIRQNYNHPSVMFWGMYNEIGDNSTTQAVVRTLVQTAHQEDPTRLTTAASDAADNAVINTIPDVIAFNKYYGWYGGVTSQFGPWADNIHQAQPNRPIGISEYGAGASIYQHEVNPSPPNSGGPWHPEEYQDLFHESYWQQMQNRPYLWAKTIWNMFDFAVDARNEGDTPGRNDKGLVTFDHQTRKDSFYWYKANWSTDPVLYITSRDYINRDAGTVEVKVYSNLDTVELQVNGVSLGVLTSSNHIFRWTGVALAPGANFIYVIGSGAAGTYTDAVTWYTPFVLGGSPFAWIVFQPAGLSVPTGYLADNGAGFDDRGNGFSYGWDADTSGDAYVRHVALDPRYDRGIAMQTHGDRVWGIYLPNGTFDIHIVSGDPSFVNSIYQLDINGIQAVSGGVRSGHMYQEAWREVTITDGLLLVYPGTGSRNDKINFIEINWLGMSPPGGGAGPSGGSASARPTPDAAARLAAATGSGSPVAVPYPSLTAANTPASVPVNRVGNWLPIVPGRARRHGLADQSAETFGLVDEV